MISVKLHKASFYNNPFVGLYLRASDRLVLSPPTISAKLLEQVEDALAVPVLKLFVNSSPLLGVFCAMNSNGVVLPSFADERECKELRKAGLNVCTIERLSPGNNIAANDHAGVVGEKMPRAELGKLSDCLGVEVHHPRFGEFPLAPTTVVTNKGLLAYNELTELELKKLEHIFGVKGVNTTSNMGVYFNSLSVVANSNGAIVGGLTSGVETQKIYEALGGD
jgi:translation initiation factor 6